MTRTIFLITSITITALAVAVPAAFGGQPPSEFEHGQGRPLGSPAQVDAITYFYANERATIPFPATIHDHGDATQAKLTRLSGPVVTPEILRDHGSAEQAKLDAQSSGTTSVVESTSGSELDWSQLAIGFGVGMLLVLGLVVGVQFARNERLAH